MHILLLNNDRPPLGGAENHVKLLSELLISKGHSVTEFYPNDFHGKTRDIKSALSELLTNLVFEVAHIHNLEYKYSYIIDMLVRKNIRVVQTLHDYRYICASGSFYRNGKTCGDCAGGKYYKSAINGCVNLFSSFGRYIKETILKMDPARIKNVSAFISPSRNLIKIMNNSGFSRNITHIYNFLELDFKRDYNSQESEPYVLFFGRLTPDKGIMTLLRAMEGTDIKLKIAGTGELEDALRAEAEKIGVDAEFHGFLQGEPLLTLLEKSRIVVVPSEWQENLPFSIIEAFAAGKSVIGSNIGGIPDMVPPHFGFLFEPGNVAELRSMITENFTKTDELKKKGEAARTFVENNMSREIFYERIMKIYATEF